MTGHRSGYTESMRIVTTHVCLSCAVAGFALLSGLALAYGMTAIAGATGVLSIIFVTGGGVILYDALRSAANVAHDWRSRWGSEVGSAPRLLRTLLVSMEHRLRMSPCRGESMEERTNRVLEALAEQRVHGSTKSSPQSAHESMMH